MFAHASARCATIPAPSCLALAPTGKDAMKGAQKPKKSGKKPAQKTLKERRSEKRAAAKQGRPIDV